MPLTLRAIRPNRFKQLNPQRSTQNVKRSMRRYLEGIAKEMEKYPPKRNPGGYQRTFELQRGWKDPIITIAPDGSSGTLVNPVKWATVAQGPHGGGRGPGQRQSRIMRSLGWQSITDVTRKSARQYRELMNRALTGTTP